jgi:transposase, IS5 family
VAIPRQATTSQPARPPSTARLPQLVKSRTGCEGRISYGRDRTLLDGKNGAAIWCGHRVFAQNLVKISALAT